MYSRTRVRALFICLLLGIHLWNGGAHAATYNISPQTEKKQAALIIKELSSGDILFVGGGDYRDLGIIRLYHKRGTEKHPIQIIAENTQIIGNNISYHYDMTGRDGNGVIIDYTAGGAIVANNVIYRVMGSGVTSTHSMSAYIVHNTIVESGYHGISRLNGVGIRMSQPDDTAAVIANNILVNNQAGGDLFQWEHVSTALCRP